MLNSLFGRIGLLPLALMITFSLAACSMNRVTHSNFAQIEEGMSESRVIELLGEPDDVVSVGFGALAGTHATWNGADSKRIMVQFLNGKVRAKQYTGF